MNFCFNYNLHRKIFNTINEVHKKSMIYKSGCPRLRRLEDEMIQKGSNKQHQIQSKVFEEVMLLPYIKTKYIQNNRKLNK